MKILNEEIVNLLIENAHYESIFQFIKTAVLVSIEEK